MIPIADSEPVSIVGTRWEPGVKLCFCGNPGSFGNPREPEGTRGQTRGQTWVKPGVKLCFWSNPGSNFVFCFSLHSQKILDRGQTRGQTLFFVSLSIRRRSSIALRSVRKPEDDSRSRSTRRVRL